MKAKKSASKKNYLHTTKTRQRAHGLLVIPFLAGCVTDGEPETASIRQAELLMTEPAVTNTETGTTLIEPVLLDPSLTSTDGDLYAAIPPGGEAPKPPTTPKLDPTKPAVEPAKIDPLKPAVDPSNPTEVSPTLTGIVRAENPLISNGLSSFIYHAAEAGMVVRVPTRKDGVDKPNMTEEAAKAELKKIQDLEKIGGPKLSPEPLIKLANGDYAFRYAYIPDAKPMADLFGETLTPGEAAAIKAHVRTAIDNMYKAGFINVDFQFMYSIKRTPDGGFEFKLTPFDPDHLRPLKEGETRAQFDELMKTQIEFIDTYIELGTVNP